MSEAISISASGIDEAIAEMRGVLDSLSGKEANRVIAKALNQSLAAGRKEASRIARRAYTAPIKKLFDQIHIKRAKGSNLEGALEISSGKGVSLIHFRADPNEPGPNPANGVTAQIKREAGRESRFSKNGGSKSFIMKKKQGGYGVFVNHGLKKKIMGPGKRKLQVIKRRVFDLEMLYGPSPIQALQRPADQEKVKEAIEEAFMPSFQEQIDKLLFGAAQK